MNLLPFSNLNSDTVSVGSRVSSADTELSDKGIQDARGEEHHLDLLSNDQFTKIGVFYSKLAWKNKE